MQKLPEKHNYSGQTLINLIIATALFAILAQALFTLVSASYSIVNFTRARIAARHLAEERLESIRNLPYDDIGTVGGIPSGNIETTENVAINGLAYVVSTSIVYIDDSFDGLAPVDLLNTDYKRIRIDVSWEGLAGSNKNPVTIITDIAPSGIESTTGGGTLSVLVFDANAVPVPQADVHIAATSTDPQVDLTLQTDSNGRVILPGAPECISACYQISISKSGYSSDRTYSTSEVANPIKPHLSVLEGQLTEVSFAIDQLGEIEISSVDDRESGFNPLPNATFSIRGDKIIGTNAVDEPVYKYEDTFTTDSNGEVKLSDIEWDNYYISVNSATGWDISGTNPHLPVNLLPDSEATLVFALTANTTHSLLTSFTDPAYTPISSVSARLFDDAGFEATESSGLLDTPDFGQVYFDDLTSQFYHLQATVSGYINFQGDVSVSGYSTEKVILTPQ